MHFFYLGEGITVSLALMPPGGNEIDTAKRKVKAKPRKARCYAALTFLF